MLQSFHKSPSGLNASRARKVRCGTTLWPSAEVIRAVKLGVQVISMELEVEAV